MKYLMAIVVCVSAPVLQGCDNQSRHVEELLRCNLAVETLGNSQAKRNFARNEVAVFGEKIPEINSRELLELDRHTREELNAPSQSASNTLVRMVATWNSSNCMALHQQEAISSEQLRRLSAG